MSFSSAIVSSTTLVSVLGLHTTVRPILPVARVNVLTTPGSLIQLGYYCTGLHWILQPVPYDTTPQNPMDDGFIFCAIKSRNTRASSSVYHKFAIRKREITLPKLTIPRQLTSSTVQCLGSETYACKRSRWRRGTLAAVWDIGS